VIFVGYTNDPIAYFIISDIYLSASKSEGFSIAVLEAMDCGLKLMLSNIPSHNEVINNSKIPIGVLFDDNSIDDAFEEISKIKTNRNSIITYKNNLYSAKIMTKQYIDKCY
jgi:glycosyltransferase involved in cell wall biosynthesis